MARIKPFKPGRTHRLDHVSNTCVTKSLESQGPGRNHEMVYPILGALVVMTPSIFAM